MNLFIRGVIRREAGCPSLYLQKRTRAVRRGVLGFKGTTGQLQLAQWALHWEVSLAQATVEVRLPCLTIMVAHLASAGAVTAGFSARRVSRRAFQYCRPGPAKEAEAEAMSKAATVVARRSAVFMGFSVWLFEARGELRWMIRRGRTDPLGGIGVITK